MNAYILHKTSTICIPVVSPLDPDALNPNPDPVQGIQDFDDSDYKF